MGNSKTMCLRIQYPLLLLLLFMSHFNFLLSSSSSSSPSTADPNSPFLCRPLQSHALLQFKSTFTISDSEASWLCDVFGHLPTPKTDSWKEGTDCCSSWEGVTCNEETGHVIELDLSCSQLVGIIHSNNTLFSPHFPPYLQKLNLAYNEFQGSDMSSQFVVKFGSSLTHLNLSSSGFSGNIPSEISHLSNLVSLDLSSNHLRVKSLADVSSSLMNLSSSLTSLKLDSCGLQGQFPVSFLLRRNLQELSLAGNFFDPVTSLPNFDSSIPSNNLTYLFLSDTDLSLVSIGFLDFVGNLESLRFLYLVNCSLSGSFLPSPANLSKLKEISLLANNLNGPIPASFCNMTQLLALDLGKNQFNGMLPSCLFVMPSLMVLRLNDNKLRGQIPDFSKNSTTNTGMFQSKNIEFLDLHSNMLQGHLPVPPSTIEFFSVSNNSLTGAISSLICNLTYLEVFDLSHNLFVGQIPPCLGNLSSLSALNLGKNNLHGTIPNTFVNNNTLKYLVLNDNRLRGRLPHSLSCCQHLEVLDVGNNMIQDVFPHWLEILSTLQVLVLRSNKLFGSISEFKSHFSFPNLRILDVSNNNLIGRLPTRLINNLHAMKNAKEELGYMRILNGTYYTGFYDYSMIITTKGLEMKYEKILKALTIIDFSQNRFEGNIPGVIGKLGALRGLNLSHNLLTGHIPYSMGDLVDLEWLDLSSNELVGQIPRVLADLTFLEVLNLSHNRLDGPIPQGKQFNTFGNDSYKENSGLCGFPLSKICGTNEETSPEKNIDSMDSLTGISWEGAFVGYGCGIVFGVLMGYLVFRKQGGHKRRDRKRN